MGYWRHLTSGTFIVVGLVISLPPIRHQAITWSNTDKLSKGSLWRDFWVKSIYIWYGDIFDADFQNYSSIVLSGSPNEIEFDGKTYFTSEII